MLWYQLVQRLSNDSKIKLETDTTTTRQINVHASYFDIKYTILDEHLEVLLIVLDFFNLVDQNMFLMIQCIQQTYLVTANITDEVYDFTVRLYAMRVQCSDAGCLQGNQRRGISWYIPEGDKDNTLDIFIYLLQYHAKF